MTTTTKENVSMGSVRELLIEQMRSLTEKGSLTADEGRHFDAMEKAVRIIGQVDTATTAGVEFTIEPGTGKLMTKRQTQHDFTRVGDRIRQEQQQYQSGDLPTATGRKYAEMFQATRLENHGFSSLHDLGNAMRAGDSQRLRQMAISGNSAGVPADGGFLVPEQFVADALDMSLESEIVRPRCRLEPMTSPTKHISSFADDDHTDGELYGGVTMRFEQEGGELNYNVLKTRRITLTAHKAAGLFSATNELITDAPESAGGMQTRMSSAFGWNVDRICLATGTGAGQPRAILNDPALITVDKEVGQAADSLVYENFVKMFARMHPACLQRAVFIINQSAIPQLLKLTITLAGGTQFVPVMTKNGNSYEILGRPVYFSEKLPALGDEGDVLFCDFTQYALGLLRGGMRLDMSQHVKFTTDETVWRLIMRFDGQGTWKQAFQPVNSAPTLSWCVTLQAR